MAYRRFYCFIIIIITYELKEQFKGYKLEQFNIIMKVHGRYSIELEEQMSKSVGRKGSQVLVKMQKTVISSTLNNVLTFKHFVVA